jgi:urate oxidase
VISGLQVLVVLKSTDSEFKGFLKDEFTTLAETDDRILATSLVASGGTREHRRRLERVVRRVRDVPAVDVRHDVLPRAAGDAAPDGRAVLDSQPGVAEIRSRRPTSTTSSSTSPASTSTG